MRITGRELLELQVRTLYRVDLLGRLVCVNDLGEPEAPRVFVGTANDGGRVMRVRTELREREWRTLLRCAGDLEAVRATLETAGTVVREHRGPAYLLPGDVHAGPRAVLVTDPAVLHPELAPYKVAVLPLLKKRPEIVDLCHRIKADLKRDMMAVYDDTAAIGKLYRRQDEIGTPWCVTVDVDSLEDGAVTVRERDTMSQERIPVEGVKRAILDKLDATRP